MDGKIHYLNTDLDLIGPVDFSSLTDALAARGLPPMYTPTQGDDGRWYCILEIAEPVIGPEDEPERTIGIMLDAIESLDPAAAELWSRCTKRDFNIGYDCGSAPWEFNQGLSNETLRRLAACGGTLRITIYPERD